MYSITRTSAPRRPHTEPISNPMAPAPITTSRSGTSVSDSASVELMIRSRSNGSPRSSTGALPVAMRIFPPSTICVPSSPTTSTFPAAAIRPAPTTCSTLWPRNSVPIPLHIAWTIFSLRVIIGPKSKSTSPRLMP